MPAFILWRCLEIKDLQINEAIRDKEVRLVGSDGEQIGVVDIAHAQNLADEAKLDLVKVAPGAKPPVCRIMDYGKYKYDLMKKEKESKKKQKVINVKELRFSPNIEEHDLQTKANQGKSFLSAGDRVKVSVRFRGRELGHTDIGRKVLDRFVELIADEGVVDKAPKMEGRSMVMFLSPKSEKNKK
ncbi:MAG: translation initiation factor IF-3 [Peptoniphilus sp. oral taxon 375]|nr:translation initiation factor IF-3 [Peptoniphilus sp. oral taxon 375]